MLGLRLRGDGSGGSGNWGGCGGGAGGSRGSGGGSPYLVIELRARGRVGAGAIFAFGNEFDILGRGLAGGGR